MKIITGYLRIDYKGAGVECGTVFTGKYVTVMCSSIVKARQAYPRNNPPGPEQKNETAAHDNVAETEKYYGLMQKGIITTKEFEARKKKPLDP